MKKQLIIPQILRNCTSTAKYMRSGGLESTKARVATESPMVAGDYIIPLHPHFLYTLLPAGAVHLAGF